VRQRSSGKGREHSTQEEELIVLGLKILDRVIRGFVSLLSMLSIRRQAIANRPSFSVKFDRKHEEALSMRVENPRTPSNRNPFRAPA